MPFIRETLAKYPRLRASRLYAMARERFQGSADHFRHVVSRFRPKAPAEAYLRVRTLPGEQGQVEWADFGKLTIGNAVRPLWAFVMVLSYSRMVFLRFYSFRPTRFLAEEPFPVRQCPSIHAELRRQLGTRQTAIPPPLDALRPLLPSHS